MKSKAYRYIILLFITTLCIVTYTGVAQKTEAEHHLRFLLPDDYAFFQSLSGDWDQYFWRFLSSAVLLGAVPFACALITGFRFPDLGIKMPSGLFKRKFWYLVLFAGILLMTVFNAYSPALYAFYPYSKTLVTTVTKGNWIIFFGHFILYSFLYYVPWEITFRGILIIPIIDLASENFRAQSSFPVLLVLASLQSIPSAMLHFGHPIAESLGAVVFGFLMALIVIRTRSIIWPVIIHVISGILLDLFIILRFAGIIP